MRGWIKSNSIRANRHWQSGGGGGWNILDPKIYNNSFYDESLKSWRDMDINFFRDHTVEDTTDIMTYTKTGLPSAVLISMLCVSSYDLSSYTDPEAPGYTQPMFKTGSIKKILPDNYTGKIVLMISETAKPTPMKDYKTEILSPSPMAFVFDNGTRKISKYVYEDGTDSRTQRTWEDPGKIHYFTVPTLTEKEVSDGYKLVAVQYYNIYFSSDDRAPIVMRGVPSWNSDLTKEIFGSVPVYQSYGTQTWGEGYMTTKEGAPKYKWKIKVELKVK